MLLRYSASPNRRNAFSLHPTEQTRFDRLDANRIQAKKWYGLRETSIKRYS